nr:CmcJ/NvfI family oxidoreductase [Microbacterium bovistercoris]
MRGDPPNTVPAVAGVINYLAADEPLPRPADALYDAYALQVHDARAVHRPFSLERNGFELVHWPSAVDDFTDPGQIERTYATEVEDFVAARLGASRVALLGACLEDAAEMERGGAQEPPVAHVELTAEDALVQARRTHAARFPEAPPFRRAVTTVCWRSITPAPQDWPLAVCDYRSVPDDDGVADGARQPQGTRFQFRPTHRWYVYPDMTPDEVLFFVVHDSDHSRPWRVMHTVFLDAQARASEPRRSLEFRSIAYFD